MGGQERGGGRERRTEGERTRVNMSAYSKYINFMKRKTGFLQGKLNNHTTMSSSVEYKLLKISVVISNTDKDIEAKHLILWIVKGCYSLLWNII